MRRSRELTVAFALLAAAIVMFALVWLGTVPTALGIVCGAVALGAAVALGFVFARHARPAVQAAEAAVELVAPPVLRTEAAEPEPERSADVIDLRDRPTAAPAARRSSSSPKASSGPIIKRIPAPVPTVAAEAEAPGVELNAAGLERRRPGSQLSPKPAGRPAAPAEPTNRSADEVRSMLRRYRSGVEAGRDQLDTPDGRPRQ